MPALGYSDAQLAELAETITGAGPDLVLDGSPARLGRILDVDIPIIPVRYRFEQLSGPPIFDIIGQQTP